MVRNMKGGNKAKKMARKNNTSTNTGEPRKTRLANPDEPCEMYAIVEKLYGQGNCGVRCNDGRERLCVIRNKFRGRNRHGNSVVVGSRLLVGLRDWEVVGVGKQEKCDLLYVYDDCEVGNLRADKTVNWTIMKGLNEEKTHDGLEENLFEFALEFEMEDKENDVDIDDI